MAISTIKAIFQSDIQNVWDIVTDVGNYSAWRSDLEKAQFIGEGQFVEYTKEGYATHFTITVTKPCERWEFDMENSNMKGHWIGIFTKRGEGTEIAFTEDVTAKKWFMKPFVGMYLRKQQAAYVKDMEKILYKN